MTISINHRFDRVPQSGLIRAYDLQAARRQFKISVALIVILTMAAFAFGFTARPDLPAAHAPSPSAPHKVYFAGTGDGAAG